MSNNTGTPAPVEFYRYEAVQYAVNRGDGEFTSPTLPNPKVELRIFHMLQETPKGYWIDWPFAGELHLGKRWVSKTSKRRFAFPTKKEALTNFIKRTERRIEILKYQKMSATFAVGTAERMMEKEDWDGYNTN